jgi:Ca2+-binding RTX toxin-like protein
VINLGGGADVVTVGSAQETIHGGGGADLILVNSATIGATIDGGTGASELVLTNAGPAVMGSNITNIHKVALKVAATFTANATNGLTILGSAGKDTLTAGGTGQTLTGDGGADTLIGYSGGGDTFRDTVAHLASDTIKGFVAGDVIDITNLKPSTTTPTSASWAGGVLTVTEGAVTDHITLPGSFTGTFTASSDGKAGADITYTAAPMVMTQAMASAGADAGAGTLVAASCQTVTPALLLAPQAA